MSKCPVCKSDNVGSNGKENCCKECSYTWDVVRTLPEQKIEGVYCVKHADKTLKFTDKDCANYVYNMRKTLKECYEMNEGFISTFEWLVTIITPSQRKLCFDILNATNKTQDKIDKLLGNK